MAQRVKVNPKVKPATLEDLIESEMQDKKKEENNRVGDSMLIKEVEYVKKESVTRKMARPIQKSFHMDAEMENKVNLVKTLMKAQGVKTTFEDILYDVLSEWMDKHLEDIKAGKGGGLLESSKFK